MHAHLSVVSATVRRAATFRKLIGLAARGRDLTDNCIPESEELDHSDFDV